MPMSSAGDKAEVYLSMKTMISNQDKRKVILMRSRRSGEESDCASAAAALRCQRHLSSGMKLRRVPAEASCLQPACVVRVMMRKERIIQRLQCRGVTER